MAMSQHNRARALQHLAQDGAPSPAEQARRLVSSWDVYTRSGVPAEPGWTAAAHALDGAGQSTAAMSHVMGVDVAMSGTLVMLGGVGSGRSYACARLLWHLARSHAQGNDKRVGRWVDASSVGSPPLYRDKHTKVPTWAETLARLTRPSLLVLDDLGAAGSSSVQLDRCKELLEARHRSGKLTIVTSNATTDETPRLLGGRLGDRAQVVSLPGGTLRTRELAPAPVTPWQVEDARRHLSALEHLDVLARQRPGHTSALAVVETWLRPQGLQDAPWEASLSAQCETLDGLADELRGKLAACVERMTVEGADAAERAREAQAKADHAAKVDLVMAARGDIAQAWSRGIESGSAFDGRRLLGEAESDGRAVCAWGDDRLGSVFADEGRMIAVGRCGRAVDVTDGVSTKRAG